MRTLLPLLLLAACTRPEPHETLPLAVDLAAHAQEEWPVQDLPFDWIPTVLGWGVHRTFVATEDPALHAYYRDWLLREDNPNFASSDSMSPALLASTALIEDDTLDLQHITDAATAYLLNAPRTDEGAIEHWAEGSFFGERQEVWVDSMFMFGLFLLQEHKRTGDEALLNELITQYLLFSQLCRDDVDDLYRHAYNDVDDVNIPAEAHYWARGNSWVLIAGTELIAELGPEDPRLDSIVPLVSTHAEALIRHQRPDGLWNTVLNVHNDDDNYPETSASALIAYGLARGIRSGLLNNDATLEALTLAVDGVRGEVDQSSGVPIVEEVSFGTNPGDYDYYLSIGTGDDLILGMGTVMMMMAEVDGLERRDPR